MLIWLALALFAAALIVLVTHRRRRARGGLPSGELVYSDVAAEDARVLVISMAEPSKEELLARIAELERQAGQKKSAGALSFKVSDKGAVSVYGMGRFPVTLYYEQWLRLLGAADELRAFLEENKSRLKLKEEA